MTDAEIESIADRVADAVLRRLVPNATPAALKVKDFAASKGVHEDTVRRWIADGMPSERAGRGIRIPVTRAEAWLANRSRYG